MSLDLTGKVIKTLRLPTTDYTGTPIQVASAEQADVNTRLLKIVMYDDRGNVSMAPYSIVVLQAEGPDGEVVAVHGEIIDGSVYILLSPDLLAINGQLTCNVVLGGSDPKFKGMVLTSQTFYIYVSRRVSGFGSIEDIENYNILIALIQRVTEMEREMDLAESAREDAEIVREDNESKRINNEEARKLAELERVEAEQIRKNNEGERKNAETVREQNEATRKSNEVARTEEFARISTELQSAESERALAEQSRKTSEKERDDSEVIRKQNEIARQSNEAARQSSETARSQEFTRITGELDDVETIRKQNEIARQSGESIRKNQETARETAEGKRAEDEDERIENELERIENEKLRQAGYAGVLDEARDIAREIAENTKSCECTGELKGLVTDPELEGAADDNAPSTLAARTYIDNRALPRMTRARYNELRQAGSITDDMVIVITDEIADERANADDDNTVSGPMLMNSTINPTVIDIVAYNDMQFLETRRYKIQQQKVHSSGSHSFTFITDNTANAARVSYQTPIMNDSMTQSEPQSMDIDIEITRQQNGETPIKIVTTISHPNNTCTVATYYKVAKMYAGTKLSAQVNITNPRTVELCRIY